MGRLQSSEKVLGDVSREPLLDDSKAERKRAWNWPPTLARCSGYRAQSAVLRRPGRPGRAAISGRSRSTAPPMSSIAVDTLTRTRSSRRQSFRLPAPLIEIAATVPVHARSSPLAIIKRGSLLTSSRTFSEDCNRSHDSRLPGTLFRQNSPHPRLQAIRTRLDTSMLPPPAPRPRSSTTCVSSSKVNVVTMVWSRVGGFYLGSMQSGISSMQRGLSIRCSALAWSPPVQAR